MITLSLACASQALPAVAFAASSPGYHARYGPLILILLGVIVIGLAVIGYLI
jgi:hypothetical protein